MREVSREAEIARAASRASCAASKRTGEDARSARRGAGAGRRAERPPELRDGPPCSGPRDHDAAATDREQHDGRAIQRRTRRCARSASAARRGESGWRRPRCRRRAPVAARAPRRAAGPGARAPHGRAALQRRDGQLPRRGARSGGARADGSHARFPDHPLAASAQLWIGEAYYQQRDYRQSLVEFKQCATAIRRASRWPTRCSSGLCHRALGDRAAARAAWEQVVREHPSSAAAGQARSLLGSRDSAARSGR